MKFTKMHGIGNDYIYVNAMEEKIDNPSEIAKNISRRHFSIGSDGLVLIMNSKIADYKMRMFNSDGSEAEMCGNAIRCVAKYVYDNRLTNNKKLSIETLAGIKKLNLICVDDKVDRVEVNMGEPIIKPSKIPVRLDKDRCVNEEIIVGGEKYKFTAVSMGNPHCVVYMDSIENLKIEKIGPLFEKHNLFPNNINTEFVEIINKTRLKMRVWERGAGETLACGTGASAVLVASMLNGFSDNEVTIELLGGELEIKWDKKTNEVLMTGEAKKVFEGEIEL